MSENPSAPANFAELLRNITCLRDALGGIHSEPPATASKSSLAYFVTAAAELQTELPRVRELVSPVRFGRIGITLGRSDSIAKFFAFSFISIEKCLMSELSTVPFYGSGIYAIYYHGRSETAYLPLSSTETPIYVGKANPKNPYAETQTS